VTTQHHLNPVVVHGGGPQIGGMLNRAVFQLRLPRRDLVWMNVELLGDLRDGAVATVPNRI
jgi:hypothetical protein